MRVRARVCVHIHVQTIFRLDEYNLKAPSGKIFRLVSPLFVCYDMQETIAMKSSPHKRDRGFTSLPSGRIILRSYSILGDVQLFSREFLRQLFSSHPSYCPISSQGWDNNTNRTEYNTLMAKTNYFEEGEPRKPQLTMRYHIMTNYNGLEMFSKSMIIEQEEVFLQSMIVNRLWY